MLLEVERLAIDLPTPLGPKRVVREVSFALPAGESLGIAGESGSGKTMTALALMGLLPDGAVVSGALRFEGRDLAKLGEEEMRKLRGDRIAMIFQEPMSALNPLHRIGAQPPLASWGRMLADAQAWMYVAPRLAIFPGLAVALSVLGLNLLGDGLRDALDPRLRARR